MLNLIKILFDRILFKSLILLEKLAYRSFNTNPLTKKPLADEAHYLKLWEEEKKVDYEVVDQVEKQMGFQIDQEWFYDLGLLTQVNVMKYKICYQHGRIVYTYLRNYLENCNASFVNIFETGTAKGFSSLCMAKALRDHDRKGKIVTLDVIPNNKKMYWNCISDPKDGKVTRYQLLKDNKELIDEHIIYLQGDSKLTMNKLDMPRIHFAFLDAIHNYDYVSAEFNYIQKRQIKGDITIFDDYSSNFPGVIKAVDELCEKHNYSKQVFDLNKENGFVVATKN